MTETPSTDPFRLSVPERLLLAHQLLDSVLAETMPLAAPQVAELRRRAAAIDAGELAVESWDLVRRRLRGQA